MVHRAGCSRMYAVLVGRWLQAEAEAAPEHSATTSVVEQAADQLHRRTEDPPRVVQAAG